MAGYEMIEGVYYEQGSDEYYKALERSGKHTSQIPLENFLVKWFGRDKRLPLAVALCGKIVEAE